MLRAVTLRDLAARIQKEMPHALEWWNGLTTAERKEQVGKVTKAERDAKKAANKKEKPPKKGKAAPKKHDGENDGGLRVARPRPPSLALLTGRLETASLLKKQIGSDGRWMESEGFRYLRENSPFAVEQRAQTPPKNGPAKKPAKAANRPAPGVREAAQNTNKKLKAAGFAPIYDFTT